VIQEIMVSQTRMKKSSVRLSRLICRTTSNISCMFLLVIVLVLVGSPVGLCLSIRRVDESRSPQEVLCGRLKRYTLFFLHFQKCGGTSIEVALKKHANRCKLGYSRFPKNWHRNLPSGKITFLTGHIPYGLHLKLPKKWDYDYVAIFRDPFARAWSHYKHNGERRCRCSFIKFSKLHVNYYQYKLVGSRSNSENVYLAASKTLPKIKLIGHMDNIDHWYTQLQDLLNNRSTSPLILPRLTSHNVRNTSKAPGYSKVGSSYNQTEYVMLKQSEAYSHFKRLNQNDYRLISELKS